MVFPGIIECCSDVSGRPYGSLCHNRTGCRSRISAPSISCRLHVEGPFRGRPPSRTSSPTQSTAMGLVAGVAVTAPAARWRAADTSAAEFGQEVATDLVLGPAAGVARGSVGLVRSGEPPRWLFCEDVPHAELVAWEADRHAGAGRDRRRGAPTLSNAGSVMSLGDALASFRPRELKAVTGWPHEGPRATLEVLQSIHGLVVAPATNHDQW